MLRLGRDALDVEDQAPELVLADHRGCSHDLAALRGRIVVLEWTSPFCPTVLAWYDSGEMQRLQAELAGRVEWLAVDSSFFAGEIADRVGAWRAERGLDAPCLLDPSGEAGRLFAAKATPTICVVDAQGRLAYRGAPSSWQPGSARAEVEEHLLDAVAALERGAPVRVAETRARGCSVKYAPEDLAASPETLAATCAEWSRGYAAEGMAEPALALWAAALRAGWPTPSDVLADPRFRCLRDVGRRRSALRELLAAQAREARVTMVDAQEPGEPLLIDGRVVDSRGAPVAGALVHAWQTDRRGLYSESDLDEENPRLFAYARTDAEGRFALRTIRPAGYAATPEEEAAEGPFEQHVHLAAEAPGFRARETRLGFRDDPVWARVAAGPPHPRLREVPPPWAAEVAKGLDGVDRCSVTIELAPR